MKCSKCGSKYIAKYGIAKYGDEYESICTCLKCGFNFVVSKDWD